MIKPLLLAAAALIGAPAWADMHMAPHAHAELLPGWRQPDGTHMAALRIVLDPGWKTYWRAPGDAGIPPSFDWTGSQNNGAMQFHWPVPEVFNANGFTTVGYSQELVLPIEVQPMGDNVEADIILEATAMIGICEQICMPMEVELHAVLAAGVQAADSRITRALGLRASNAEEAGVTSVTCVNDPVEDGLRVTATLDMPALGPNEFAVIEAADSAIWVSEAMVKRDGDQLTAMADLVAPSGAPFTLDPASLRFTVLAAGRAVEIEGCTETR